MSADGKRVNEALLAESNKRIWFYRPQWYWHGWKTLLPVYRGHDDFARWTLVLGWTITGRIVIALNDCGDDECHEWRDEMLEATNA